MTQQDEKISLIVPCHNHGSFLERALRSTRHQSGLLEVILVDDASSDDTAAFIREQERADERVRGLFLTENGGPGRARNEGARIAAGEYLSFLDADDELLEDAFLESLSALEADPSMHAVKAHEDFFDPIKGWILPPSDPRYQAAVLSSVPGLLVRRSTFERLGGFPESRAFCLAPGGEDVAFMQALIKHFPPLGSTSKACYRVWSCHGSHVDRFLASTRLTESGGFEFVSQPTREYEAVNQAIDEFLEQKNNIFMATAVLLNDGA